MFTESDLRELLAFKAPDQMITLYLNTEPSKGNADAYRLRMRTLLKDVHLAQDVAAIEHFFDGQYTWSGRSVAIFSCAAAGFFHAYTLAVPVRDMLEINDRPGLQPLVELLDNYGGFGVVLVDQQGARLFHFHMGELREQEGVLGEEVKRTKHGGSSSVTGQRGGTAGQTQYVEQTVKNNMKDAASFAVHFFEENHVRRLLIGGTDENVHLFKTHLPKAWQSLVMGSFAMSMSASHSEVLSKAMQLGQESEMQREARLVSDIITSAAKGKLAVVGVSDTLQAVNEGRVQVLVVNEGFKLSGYACEDCDMLATDPKICEPCHTLATPIDDMIDLAVIRVLRQGGHVEVVHPLASLEKAGNVAAQLRY